MTITEALNELRRITLNRYFPDLCNAITMAIDALREKQERENPQLLTIEELKQMDGEPVWLADEKVWGIINIDDDGNWKGKPFINFIWKHCEFNWDIEARELTCYRHKPKEG